MKKLLFLFVLFFSLPEIAKAQFVDSLIIIKNGKVAIEQVVPYDIPKKQAYEAVRNFYINHTNSNEPLRLVSEDEIIARIITGQLTTHVMGSWEVRAHITIDCRFKNGRMKVVISCDKLVNKGFKALTKVYEFSPLDAAPFANPHPANRLNILEKPAIRAWNALQLEMLGIFRAIVNSLSVETEEDNW